MLNITQPSKWDCWRLAAGVAHEINNTIDRHSGFAEGLKWPLPKLKEQ